MSRLCSNVCVAISTSGRASVNVAVDEMTLLIEMVVDLRVN